MRYLVLGLLLPMLSACDMWVYPWQKDTYLSSTQRPIVCSTKQDCDALWSRASDWARRNANGKFAENTDTLIRTEKPPENSPLPAFAIAMMPRGDGSYVITINAACDNLIGCTPPILKLKADFTNSMLSPARVMP